MFAPLCFPCSDHAPVWPPPHCEADGSHHRESSLDHHGALHTRRGGTKGVQYLLVYHVLKTLLKSSDAGTCIYLWSLGPFFSGFVKKKNTKLLDFFFLLLLIKKSGCKWDHKNTICNIHTNCFLNVFECILYVISHCISSAFHDLSHHFSSIFHGQHCCSLSYPFCLSLSLSVLHSYGHFSRWGNTA